MSSGRREKRSPVVRVVTGLVALALVLAATGCSAFGDDETTATTVPNGVRIVDLEPGTCFQAPANTDVRTVEEVGCDTPHDAEAYAVFALPAGAHRAAGPAGPLPPRPHPARRPHGADGYAWYRPERRSRIGVKYCI